MSIHHQSTNANDPACPAYQVNSRALPVHYSYSQQHQYQTQQQQQHQPQQRYYKKSVRLLPDCRPEEVEVKVDGKLVKIRARRHLSGEGGDDLCERTVLLPDEADANSVVARLNTEGCLLVRAPLLWCNQHQQRQQQPHHHFYGQDQHHQQSERLDQVAFMMQVSARDFHPDEISVRLLATDGGCCRALVQAEHLALQLDGTRLHRSLHFEFPLPAGIDPACLESRLTDQGVVEIWAAATAAGPAANANIW